MEVCVRSEKRTKMRRMNVPSRSSWSSGEPDASSERVRFLALQSKWKEARNASSPLPIGFSSIIFVRIWSVMATSASVPSWWCPEESDRQGLNTVLESSDAQRYGISSEALRIRGPTGYHEHYVIHPLSAIPKHSGSTGTQTFYNLLIGAAKIIKAGRVRPRSY